MDGRESSGEPSGIRRGKQLAGMFARLERSQRNHEQSMTLGTADLRMLWLFADGRSRTLKQISHELGLEQSTVNRQVNAAVDQGLLKKSHPSGGSAYQILSTPAGREAFEKDVDLSLSGYEVALESLGAQEAATFLDLLGRFLEAYDELAPPGDSC